MAAPPHGPLKPENPQTDEQKRQRLRSLGWQEAGVDGQGGRLWRKPPPDNANVVAEDVAFRTLERM